MEGNEFITSIVALGGVPLILGLVQLFKPFITDTRFYPLVALAFGLAISLMGRDPGGSELLNEYFSQRRLDRIATILFTDTLIRLFCKDIPLLNGARGLSLAAFGAIPAAKNFLARRMMFGARG